MSWLFVLLVVLSFGSPVVGTGVVVDRTASVGAVIGVPSFLSSIDGGMLRSAVVRRLLLALRGLLLLRGGLFENVVEESLNVLSLLLLLLLLAVLRCQPSTVVVPLVVGLARRCRRRESCCFGGGWPWEEEDDESSACLVGDFFVLDPLRFLRVLLLSMSGSFTFAFTFNEFESLLVADNLMTVTFLESRTARVAAAAAAVVVFISNCK